MNHAAVQLRQDSLTWNAVGDDLVILDLESSSYLKLNASARVMWELLAQRRTEPDLVDALVDRYGIDHERAARDVSQFVAALRSRGLLQQ